MGTEVSPRRIFLRSLERQWCRPLASRLSRGKGISSMRGGIAERAVEVVCASELSLHGYAGPRPMRTESSRTGFAELHMQPMARR